eukprot:UN11711
MKTVPHLELPVDNAQFERSNSQDSLASFMSDVSQSAFSVMSSEADESPLPEPTHIWSMRDSKKGTKDLTHCGVPFPRAKNGSMFFGDSWKGYFKSTEKSFRFNKEFTLSVFFKPSEHCLLDLHEPLTILSKGPLRKSLSIWIQRRP